VDFENVVQIEEIGRRLSARPYLRLTFSRAALKRFRRPSWRTGETISVRPSVEISNGVSGVILSRSSTPRSITRARLLPCRVSLLIMVSSFR